MPNIPAFLFLHCLIPVSYVGHIFLSLLRTAAGQWGGRRGQQCALPGAEEGCLAPLGISELFQIPTCHLQTVRAYIVRSCGLMQDDG